MALSASVLKSLIVEDLTAGPNPQFVIGVGEPIDKLLTAICTNIVLHITTASVITGADPQGGVVTSVIT